MAAYADSDDLGNHFDATVLADLASDTGTPVADLSTDTRIAAALDAASGRVESALMVGGQYTAADLSALTGNSQALLKELVCTLAMQILLRRRPGSRHDELYKPAIEETNEFLDRLRKGERVFGGSAEHVEAGQPSIDGPSTTTYERLNLIPDRTKHYYPNRGGRLPIGRANG